MRTPKVHATRFSQQRDALSAKSFDGQHSQNPIILITTPRKTCGMSPDLVRSSVLKDFQGNCLHSDSADAKDSDSSSTATSSFYRDSEEQMLPPFLGDTNSPSQFSAGPPGMNVTMDLSRLNNATNTKLPPPSAKRTRGENTSFSNIGFGVDQKKGSKVDGAATEAAIRAVRDAMERLVTPPFFNREDTSVCVKLGVPGKVGMNTSEDPPSEMKPMDIDITRVAAAIPSGRLKTIDIVLGGLSSITEQPLVAQGAEKDYVATEEDGNSTTSICCVVAYVTMEKNEASGLTGTDMKKESLEELRHALSEKEEELRIIKEGTEFQASLMRIRINEMEQQLLKYGQERMRWECQAEVLRKRLSLKDESLMMLATTGETLKMKLNESRSTQVIPRALKPPVPLPLVTATQNEGLSDLSMAAIDEKKHRKPFQLNHPRQMKPSTKETQPGGSVSEATVVDLDHKLSVAGKNVALGKKDSAEKQAVNENDSSFVSCNPAPMSLAEYARAELKAAKAEHQKILSASAEKVPKPEQGEKNHSEPPPKTTCAPKNLCEHDYTDHSMALPTVDDSAEGYIKKKKSTGRCGGMSPAFPQKFHRVLDEIEANGHASIISWLPHGRAFKIHKQQEFLDIILPQYLIMTKKSSFLRQLNLYGFQRLSAGLDKGAYYHEKFLRGMLFLTYRIIRLKVNGKGVRAAGNPDSEPNFYGMPPLPLKEKFPECSSLPIEKLNKPLFLTRAKEETWRKQELSFSQKEAAKKREFLLPKEGTSNVLVRASPNPIAARKLQLLGQGGIPMKPELSMPRTTLPEEKDRMILGETAPKDMKLLSHQVTVQLDQQLLAVPQKKMKVSLPNGFLEEKSEPKGGESLNSTMSSEFLEDEAECEKECDNNSLAEWPESAKTPFTEKLYDMLSELHASGNMDVSWMPHGRCFKVHNREQFTSQILPRYFKQSKYTSFQRQLRIYSFQRIGSGVDKGSYYNGMFLRGHRDLCRKIPRVTVNGNGYRMPSNPDTEPDFYKMEPMPPIECKGDSSTPDSPVKPLNPFPNVD